MSSSTLRIFSGEEWKELYSDADSISQRGKTYPFHFMTARNPKEETLIVRIKAASDKLIVADDKEHHKLTPLIIAVMRGKTRIVEELLSKEIVRSHINDPDAYGWTPLHHAAFTSDEIFQKLLACGADRSCLTLMKGSTDDLKALSSWEGKALSLEHVSYEGKPLSAEIAKAEFNLSYRDIPYYSQLKPLWQQEQFQEEPLANHLILRLRHRIPKVVISAIDKAKGIYGLAAGEELPAGTVIGEYGGAYSGETSGFETFFPEGAKKFAYFFNGFDAREVGNATRFMNCGFPNASPLPMVENGVAKVIFVAHQLIQKGEPILYNYGGKAYDVTCGPQILFNRDQMHAFFKPGLEAILKENDAVDQQISRSRTKDQATDLYLKRAQLRCHTVFPLDNPLALIDLHFSGTVPAKDWFKLLIHLNHPSVLEWAKQIGMIAYSRVCQLTLRLAKIDCNIQTKAKEWVLERCQTATLMNLMKGIEWIAEDPKLIDEIDDRLKSYDWKLDPSNLFSYEGRKSALERYIHLTLLGEKPINFHAQKIAFIEKLEKEAEIEVRLRNLNSQGSEFAKMLKEIKESPPKDPKDLMEELDETRRYLL